MAEHGHDFIGAASGLCKPPTGSLAQTMGLAFEREVGGPDCCAHPLTETINRERLSVLGVDDGYMVTVGMRPAWQAIRDVGGSRGSPSRRRPPNPVPHGRCINVRDIIIDEGDIYALPAMRLLCMAATISSNVKFGCSTISSISSITRACKSLEYGLGIDCSLTVESMPGDALIDKPLRNSPNRPDRKML